MSRFDYGQGTREGFAIQSSGRRLGMRVILTLARQLGGDVAVRNVQPGARWTVRLPAPSAASVECLME